MALNEYKDIFKKERKNINIVFGIVQKTVESADGNHINQVLEEYQIQLREKAKALKADKKDTQIYKAFVFSNKRVYVKTFEETNLDTICYAEHCSSSAKISDIWHMGLAVLEKKAQKDKKAGFATENILCIISNDDITRKESQKILMSQKKYAMTYTPQLIKCAKIEGGNLEAMIREHGKVYE